ncbi:hypothetical protein LY76DRAFT_393981 [Colletotrichum caudatum]|nr:hypothetical protein LY76DRAFT_393981 [Colletotrichum caudatum]
MLSSRRLRHHLRHHLRHPRHLLRRPRRTHLRVRDCRHHHRRYSPSKRVYDLRRYDHILYRNDGLHCGYSCCKPWRVGVCSPDHRCMRSSWSETVSTCFLRLWMSMSKSRLDCRFFFSTNWQRTCSVVLVGLWLGLFKRQDD